MTCQEIMEQLEELSPRHYAEDWDNVGLLCGDTNKRIKSIYIALDATKEVIDEAVALGADMILTHHPMIFKGMKRIISKDFIGCRIIELIQNDICYYAMHTNFDIMGMADAAADELKLRNREVLQVTYEDDISVEGFGRLGDLPHEMTLRECAQYIKQCFDISMVRVFGEPETPVYKAAICPGSGKSMIPDAVKKGAEVYITGDIGHHDGINAVAQGLSVVDAGHYGIEHIFVDYMEQYIRREMPELTIYKKQPKEPCWFI